MTHLHVFNIQFGSPMVCLVSILSPLSRGSTTDISSSSFACHDMTSSHLVPILPYGDLPWGQMTTRAILRVHRVRLPVFVSPGHPGGLAVFFPRVSLGWRCTSSTYFENNTHYPSPMSDTWKIAPISTPRLTWGTSSNNRATDRRCRTCGVELLTGERAGFCCGPNGNRYTAIQRLPPLPDEFNTFLNSPDVSRLSRKLNLIFSFAAMESTHAFPTPGNPSFVAVSG